MRRRTALLIGADDCSRNDLRAILAELDGVQLVGEAMSAREVRRLAATVPAPDVVIAAARVQGASALPLLTAIRREYWPAARLLVFAPHLDPAELFAFADLGVRQYLLWRDLSPEEIRHDLALMLERDVVLHRGAVATAFLDEIQRYRRLAGSQYRPAPLSAQPCRVGHIPCGRLTPREWEVLRLVALGQDNKQIASTLGISPDTVRKHVEAIFRKLQLHRRGEVVAWAWERRLADEPDAGAAGL